MIGFCWDPWSWSFPGLRAGWYLALDLFLFAASACASFYVMRLNKKDASRETSRSAQTAKASSRPVAAVKRSNTP